MLTPTLFIVMFSAILTDAFHDVDPGFAIKYLTRGKLLNLRRLQAKTNVSIDRLRDFLFVDDCALNAGSETDMQHSMDKFSTSSDSFGLTISIRNT
jgi:hypothetical protein